MTDLQPMLEFLNRGGPAMWVIALLSVATLALILWKIWRLSVLGAWRRGPSEQAVEAWCAGDGDVALGKLGQRNGLRTSVIRAAMQACGDPAMEENAAREETTRVAKYRLNEARAGLRGLELIATIAPLIGLLGTVLGMIDAFQTLQESGSRADATALAGGIWQALLTTAAGMTVAIPASVALSWFESITDSVQLDLEDAATRIFTAVGKR